MTTTVRNRMRLTSAVVAMAAVMFALVPAAPASAGQLTIGVEGIATLSAGYGAPCAQPMYSGTFDGTANGLHGTTPVVNASVTATFLYCNTLLSGVAEGSINIAGHSCSFTWLRIGVTAIVEIFGCDSRGTAVAEFIPTSAPGALPGTAIVVGQGIVSDRRSLRGGGER